MEKLNYEIQRWSKLNGYTASEFYKLICPCGNTKFNLFSDEVEGGAYGVCCNCSATSDIENSKKFINDATQNICNCDNSKMEISIGNAYYPDSQDVRWVYVGCECEFCGLVGMYCDWSEK